MTVERFQRPGAMHIKFFLLDARTLKASHHSSTPS